MKKPSAARPKAPKAPPPTAEAVAAKLLASAVPGEPPALLTRPQLNRRLTTTERPQLDPALANLQEQRQLLALRQGAKTLYLFAEPLRAWLAGEATPEGVDSAEEFFALYQRLVRESGGFPDVKIAALRAALTPEAARSLPGELIALWREGRATLSLGDWSLASEDTRAAAVEMDGEKYLLVRFDLE